MTLSTEPVRVTIETADGQRVTGMFHTATFNMEYTVVGIVEYELCLRSTGVVEHTHGNIMETADWEEVEPNQLPPPKRRLME